MRQSPRQLVILHAWWLILAHRRGADLQFWVKHLDEAFKVYDGTRRWLRWL